MKTIKDVLSEIISDQAMDFLMLKYYSWKGKLC